MLTAFPVSRHCTQTFRRLLRTAVRFFIGAVDAPIAAVVEEDDKADDDGSGEAGALLLLLLFDFTILILLGVTAVAIVFPVAPRMALV